MNHLSFKIIFLGQSKSLIVIISRKQFGKEFENTYIIICEVIFFLFSY